MEAKFWNSKKRQLNVKALEKELKHPLDWVETEYAIYYYESGNTGIPDFGSERFCDFVEMIKEEA